ncbi:MAG: 30S ribosomal protein S6 [Pyrinomonadaceae bacterium]|jgi:small subunit ribosomal protein S6
MKLANRTYEVMYIVDPETAADKIVELNETIGKLIEKEGGTIVRMDDIGMRTLAYPIKKRKDGYYVLFEVDGTGQEIMELERRMRVNDAIIRFVTVRVDEDRKKALKMAAKREKRAAQRSKFRKTEETAETAGELQEA